MGSCKDNQEERGKTKMNYEEQFPSLKGHEEDGNDAPYLILSYSSLQKYCIDKQRVKEAIDFALKVGDTYAEVRRVLFEKLGLDE